jgi:hypothetical protein
MIHPEALCPGFCIDRDLRGQVSECIRTLHGEGGQLPRLKPGSLYPGAAVRALCPVASGHRRKDAHLAAPWDTQLTADITDGVSTCCRLVTGGGNSNCMIFSLVPVSRQNTQPILSVHSKMDSLGLRGGQGALITPEDENLRCSTLRDNGQSP